MKKRMLCMLLAVVAVFAALSGCGTSDNTPADTSVSNVLTAVTYEQYAGTWAQEEIGWLYGGVMLDISAEGDTLQVAYCEVSAAPISDQAEFGVSIPISDIQGNSIEASFENDGWGNAGTMRITFDDDQILCKISDVHYVGENWDALWGATATTSVLVRMDNAHDLVEYTLDDYYEMFPDENPDNWIDDSSSAEPAPSSNLSTASGILANLGMTENEFRASCTSLQTIGHLGGSVLLPSYDSELLNSIRDYPGQYVGNLYNFPYFYVEQKGSSPDGYLYYLRLLQDGPIQIFDFRDDPYSPMISEEDHLNAYVIFTGVQLNGLGQDVLCFQLISCDKQ